MKRITMLLTFSLATLAADALAQPFGYFWCGNAAPRPTSPPPPPCNAPPPPCDCGKSTPAPPAPTSVSDPNHQGAGGGGSGGSGGGGSCSCSGSPCYVSSGSYVTSATDLQMPTTGFPLSAFRSYESGRPIDSILGVGWTTNVASHLYYATWLYSAPRTYQPEADIVLPGGARHRFSQKA